VCKFVLGVQFVSRKTSEQMDDFESARFSIKSKH